MSETTKFVVMLKDEQIKTLECLREQAGLKTIQEALLLALKCYLPVSEQITCPHKSVTFTTGGYWCVDCGRTWPLDGDHP